MTERHIRDFSLDFFSLSGKKAIVTGGNRGLGQAYAVAMAKAGADLYIPTCLLYTSPSPRDGLLSRMPSSA